MSFQFCFCIKCRYISGHSVNRTVMIPALLNCTLLVISIIPVIDYHSVYQPDCAIMYAQSLIQLEIVWFTSAQSHVLVVCYVLAIHRNTSLQYTVLCNCSTQKHVLCNIVLCNCSTQKHVLVIQSVMSLQYMVLRPCNIQCYVHAVHRNMSLQYRRHVFAIHSKVLAT